MNNTFTKNYTINIYDVNSKLQCKYSSLVNYFWDVVMSHASAVGETSNVLINNNCVWVVLKYDIDIFEYPNLNETITVETKVLGNKRLYAYRQFVIKNSKGKTIASSISTAILIDLEKRRPVRISAKQLEIYNITNELNEAYPLDDILKLEKEEFHRDYIVSHSDIDSNEHVNNMKYMEMAMDSLPPYIIKEYDLCNIKTLFKKEAIYGANLHIASEVIENENNELTTVHAIYNQGNDKPITKLQFKWRKG